MKAIFNRILILAILVSSAFSGQAQKTSFDDVRTVSLQNSGPILENGQVKGYYMFYMVDKVDRKSRAYMLRILDENLRDVAKKKFIKSKHTSLKEATYNNKAFLFSFVDYKAKTLELVSYDKEMKRLGKRTIELDKWALSQYYTQGTNKGTEMEPSLNKMIFPIGDRGFMRYNMKKNKKRKIGYELEYLPNDLKKSGTWNKDSPEESKAVLMAGYGDANDKYLVSSITSKPKMLSNKGIAFSISVLNLETKKIVFEKELKSKKYIYSFMNAFINDEKETIMVFGEYFNPGDNIVKAKSQGLCALEYDMKGKIIGLAHHSWEGAIAKKIGVDKKGRIEDGGYVAFHRITKSADGHYYAVGEMYKKSVSGLGVAAKMLGGQGALVKMVILDMIIFDFNADLSLNDVEVIEKRKSDFFLAEGMGIYPPTLLAYVIRAYGGFDYSYTQENEDKSSFFSTFSSTSKEKGKKRKAYFGIIAHTDGDNDYVLDKVDLSTDASYIRVLPAKPGYIMLIEYFRKAKKIETRLEKINY